MDTTVILLISMLAGSGVCSSSTDDTWDWEWLHKYELHVSRDTLNWFAARRECLQRGADLMAFDNSIERKKLLEMIDKRTSHAYFWIGMNKYQSEEWHWSNGEDIIFEDWEHGYPEMSSEREQMCAYMSVPANGKWLTQQCGYSWPYICKRTVGHTEPVDVPPPKPVPGYCPDGYTGLDGDNQCFKVVPLAESEGFTWDEARRQCERGGGLYPDLATVQSVQHNALLTSQLREANTGLWLGMQRDVLTEKTFYWMDNSEVVFTNWAENQPTGLRDCALMRYSPRPTGAWDDDYCSTKRGYICHTYKDMNNTNMEPPVTPPNTCRDGFAAYGDGCYRVESNSQTWQQAVTSCLAFNSSLVSIHDEPENSAILLMISSLPSGAWIGLKEDSRTKEYSWVDGSYTLFTKLGLEEADPPPGTDHTCIAMRSHGYWYNTDCSQTLPFVCKINTGPDNTPPPPVEGACPGAAHGEWFDIGYYCYHIPREIQSWDTAQAVCQSLHQGASLASVHDHVTNDLIYRKFQELKDSFINSNMWLGLHRPTPGGLFEWIDQDSLRFTPWAPAQPSLNDNVKACVSMDTSDKHGRLWTDDHCESYLNFVCKVAKGDAITQVPVAPGICPQDIEGKAWAGYGSVCYLFMPDRLLSWEQSRQYCQLAGGDEATLARPENENENRFVSEVMLESNQLPGVEHYWIGLSRRDAESPFLWADTRTPPVETFFASPSEPGFQQHCVDAYLSTGLWRYEKCSMPKGFACMVQKGEPVDMFTTPPGGAGGEPKSPKPGHSAGQTTGIVIGSLIGVAVFAVLVAAVVMNRKKLIEMTGLEGFINPNYETQDNEP